MNMRITRQKIVVLLISVICLTALPNFDALGSSMFTFNCNVSETEDGGMQKYGLEQEGDFVVQWPDEGAEGYHYYYSDISTQDIVSEGETNKPTCQLSAYAGTVFQLDVWAFSEGAYSSEPKRCRIEVMQGNDDAPSLEDGGCNDESNADNGSDDDSGGWDKGYNDYVDDVSYSDVPHIGWVGIPSVNLVGMKGMQDNYCLIDKEDAVFRWEADGDVAYYLALLVNSNGEELSPSTRIDQTSVTIPKESLAEGNTYRFRVAAVPVNGSDADAQWAELLFMIDSQRVALDNNVNDEQTGDAEIKQTDPTPEIEVSPEDVIEVGVVNPHDVAINGQTDQVEINHADGLLTWGADGDVAYYRVQIRNETSGVTVLGPMDTFDTQLTIPLNALEEGSTYHVVVGTMPTNGNNENMLWRELRFSVIKPRVEERPDEVVRVGMVNPHDIAIDGQTGQVEIDRADSLLTWGADGDVAYYRVQIKNETSGVTVLEPMDTFDTHLTIPLNALEQGSTYYVTVGTMPTNGNNEYMQWRELRFTVKAEPVSTPTPIPALMANPPLDLISDSISLSETSWDASGNGDSKSITVTSSGSWAASTNEEWISLSQSSGSSGRSTAVSVSAYYYGGVHPGYLQRIGTVTFTCGAKTVELTITQYRGSYITLSMTSWEGVSAGGDSTYISVSTNTTWAASTSEDWISMPEPSMPLLGGTREGTSVKVSANTSASPRTGTVTFTSPGWAETATATLTITQSGQGIVTPVGSAFLNTSSASVDIGRTYQLAATVRPSNATNQSVTWTSSNPVLATVNSAGLVTAKIVGTVTITAKTTDGAKTAVCTVTVKPLAGTVTPREGLNIRQEPSVSSSILGAMPQGTQCTVNSVENNGFYLISHNGIWGYASAQYIKVDIPVAVPVIGVALNRASVSVDIGKTYQLAATVSPQNATDKFVTWASSNTSVATVNSAGLVTAKAAGAAKITATTVDGGKTAICTVTVKTHEVSPPAPDSSVKDLSITAPDTFSLQAGSTKTLSVSFSGLGIDSIDVTTSGSGLSAKIAETSWNAYPSTCTAKISIIATSDCMGGTLTFSLGNNQLGVVQSKSIAVAVERIPVTSVSLSPPPASIGIGKTYQLTALVSPSNATDKSVMWASSNTTVATVSSTGLVTAKAAGTATITVKTVDGAKTETCTVAVKTSGAISVTGIKLNTTSISLSVGSYRLKETVLPSSATNKSVMWASSNPTVATVSSTGLVNPKAAGTTTITVKTIDGGFQASCEVKVDRISLDWYECDNHPATRNIIHITPTSGSSWTATTRENWISLSPSKGASGQRTVVTISENTSTSRRTGDITFTCGTMSTIFRIRQDGASQSTLGLTSYQQYVADKARSLVGATTLPIGGNSVYWRCQAFVYQCVYLALNKIPQVDISRGTAREAFNSWKVSTSTSNIPVGAAVYYDTAVSEGHVGIYVGNDQVVHAASVVSINTLEEMDALYGYLGWGWQAGYPLN